MAFRSKIVIVVMAMAMGAVARAEPISLRIKVAEGSVFEMEMTCDVKSFTLAMGDGHENEKPTGQRTLTDIKAKVTVTSVRDGVVRGLRCELDPRNADRIINADGTTTRQPWEDAGKSYDVIIDDAGRLTFASREATPIERHRLAYFVSNFQGSMLSVKPVSVGDEWDVDMQKMSRLVDLPGVRFEGTMKAKLLRMRDKVAEIETKSNVKCRGPRGYTVDHKNTSIVTLAVDNCVEETSKIKGTTVCVRVGDDGVERETRSVWSATMTVTAVKADK